MTCAVLKEIDRSPQLMVLLNHTYKEPALGCILKYFLIDYAPTYRRANEEMEWHSQSVEGQ